MRQKYNQELLQILTKAVEKWPDLRFSQILTSLKFVSDGQKCMDCKSDMPHWEDEFYLESKDLLDRVKKDMVE